MLAIIDDSTWSPPMAHSYMMNDASSDTGIVNIMAKTAICILYSAIKPDSTTTKNYLWWIF